MIPQMSPQELQTLLNEHREGVLVVDVREPNETDAVPAPFPHVDMPLSRFAEEFQQLNPESEIIMLCRSGGRSMQAAKLLEEAGYTHVSNLDGGLLAWRDTLDPTLSIS